MNDEKTQTTSENPTNGLAKKFKKIKLNYKVNSKVLIIFFGILLAAFMLYLVKGEAIAAVVNGRPVSRFAVLRESERRGGLAILEGLVNENLIDQEIKKRKIEVTDQEIDDDYAKIEESLKSSGSSIDEEMEKQNLTQAKLRKILTTNKKLEKLIADRVTISDEEINNYMETNKSLIPEDADQNQIKESVKSFLTQQKVEQATNDLIAELRAKAKIYYWKQY